jgi:hypothetical protein
MTVWHGIAIAAGSAAITFMFIAAAGLALVANRIQEERYGIGCRSAGCRRSRSGNGCDQSRTAERVRDLFNGGV